MTPEQLVVLRDEIQNDPESLGYAGKDHKEIAELLNKPQRQVDNDDEVSVWKIFGKFDRQEYSDVLDTPKKEKILGHILSMGLVNPSDGNLRKALVFVFGQGSKTIANLVALAKRSGSRAEELGLPRVTPSHVAKVA